MACAGLRIEAGRDLRLGSWRGLRRDRRRRHEPAAAHTSNPCAFTLDESERPAGRNDESFSAKFAVRANRAAASADLSSTKRPVSAASPVDDVALRGRARPWTGAWPPRTPAGDAGWSLPVDIDGSTPIYRIACASSTLCAAVDDRQRPDQPRGIRAMPHRAGAGGTLAPRGKKLQPGFFVEGLSHVLVFVERAVCGGRRRGSTYRLDGSEAPAPSPGPRRRTSTGATCSARYRARLNRWARPSTRPGTPLFRKSPQLSRRRGRRYEHLTAAHRSGRRVRLVSMCVAVDEAGHAGSLTEDATPPPGLITSRSTRARR